MIRWYTPFIVCTLMLVLAGCTEEAPTAAEDASPEISAPSGVLGEGAAPQFLRPMGPKTPQNTDGFASPLFGLASTPNGDLVVADAGAGISDGTGGLILALPGVSDLAPIGTASMWAIVGLTGAPGEDTGQGLYRTSRGNARLIADLFQFEDDENPDGGVIDSNPFDVYADDGRTALVVDAGANALLRVTNQGDVEVVATFPVEEVSTENFNDLAGCPDVDPYCATGGLATMDAQAVPTSIAVGPDGAIYVGELKGFPAPTDASNIWRIEPGATNVVCPSDPECTKVFDGGFTSIIDLAFGPDGRLYVSEFDERSWAAVEIFGLVTGGTVNACDLNQPTPTCEEVATSLPVHTAIAFDGDGMLWATINALTPGDRPDGADVVMVP